MRTALGTLTAAGLVLTSSLLAIPGQAVASTAAIPAGNAPSCVTVWEHTGRITKTGYARNDCPHTLNLKIVWARGTDGPCRTVRPGQSISTQVPRGVRSFDGADLC
ncbi:hypothetical protein [Nonomuraea dietziae]|uniref:hypothetical protein n=1 Tax=Nonomuraea dietziae TaxID=65515 RepID=UPI0033CAF71A